MQSDEALSLPQTLYCRVCSTQCVLHTEKRFKQRFKGNRLNHHFLDDSRPLSIPFKFMMIWEFLLTNENFRNTVAKSKMNPKQPFLARENARSPGRPSSKQCLVDRKDACETYRVDRQRPVQQTGTSGSLPVVGR